jgi:hypothetical protein
MKTQQFLGKGQLINRLAMQVGDRAKAISILQKRGHLKADGKTFTAEGEKRNQMSAAERAIDRESRSLNKPKNDFTYNPKTNTAKIKSNGTIKQK